MAPKYAAASGGGHRVLSYPRGARVSTYASRWQAAVGVDGHGSQLPEDFRDAFPNIALLLCGLPSPGGSVQSVPRASVTIFEEGGKVKFVISPKQGQEVAFGTITEPEKGFTGLEWELAEGRYEWKKGSRR